MSMLLQDIRQSLNTVWRNPLFSIVAVLTVAIGIGGATAMFSLIDGVLLRPLPYRDSGRLVVIREVVPALTHLYPSFGGNLRHVQTWREQSSTLDQIAVARGGVVNVTGGGAPERVHVVRVSANMFTTLGVSPSRGRTFLSEEDLPGRDRVVLLSHAVWLRRYQGDPAIVDKTIALDGQPHTVVGVLPPSFRFPRRDELGPFTDVGERADLFVPLGVDLATVGPFGAFDYAVVARLKPGVSVPQAEQDVDRIQRRIEESLPRRMELRASLQPLQEESVRHVRRGLWMLMAAVGAVLLIGCVNLANLLLLRGETKQRELVIRTALGASRRRLMMQIVVDCVVLALLAGVVGLGIAAGAVQVLTTTPSFDMPSLADVGLNARVFAYALGLSILTGLLFAVLPAWRLTKANPQDALVAGNHRISGNARTRKVLDGLVGMEVALTTALLIVTGFLLLSIARLTDVDKGFQADRLLTTEISLPPTAYEPVERRQDFIRRLLTGVEGMPGVTAAGVVSTLPLKGEGWVDVITPDGNIKPDLERPIANFRFVSPSYFKTLGLQLRDGRGFGEGDRGRQVAIVSDRTAQRVWNGQPATGRTFRRGNQKVVYDVVGVVGDVRSNLEKAPPLVVYIPYWGEGNLGAGPPLTMSLVVRTSLDTAAIGTGLGREISTIDPSLPPGSMQTMQAIVDESLSGRRFQATLLMVFAGCAVFLAGIGIYGVSAFAVLRRTNEFGVRMAMGATPTQIRNLVLRQAATPALIGLVVGIGAALGLYRVLQTLLFEIGAGNPLVMGGSVLAVLVVIFLATLVPVRRATRLEPIEAVRD